MIKFLAIPFDKIIIMTENKEINYLCIIGIEQNKSNNNFGYIKFR